MSLPRSMNEFDSIPGPIVPNETIAADVPVVVPTVPLVPLATDTPIVNPVIQPLSQVAKLKANTERFHVGKSQYESDEAELPEQALKQSFETLIQQLEEDEKKKHFWNKSKVNTANRIAALASDLQIELAKDQVTLSMTDEQFKQFRAKAILTFETNCKKTPVGEKIGKALAAVCCAVVGLIAGVVVGAAIGYGLSAWTGPAGFVCAAVAAFIGGPVGAMMGVTFALGGAAAVSAGFTSGHLLFKPAPAKQRAQDVGVEARQSLNLSKAGRSE